MNILAIEIMGNAAGMLLLSGNKNDFSITNLKKPIKIDKEDTSIKGIMEFQNDFLTFLQHQKVDSVILCEGGKDAKKARVRMEYAILSTCEQQTITYNTYPTGSCTRIINSGYEKETKQSFTKVLEANKLPKYMGKTLAAGWKFL